MTKKEAETIKTNMKPISLKSIKLIKVSFEQCDSDEETRTGQIEFVVNAHPYESIEASKYKLHVQFKSRGFDDTEVHFESEHDFDAIFDISDIKSYRTLNNEQLMHISLAMISPVIRNMIMGTLDSAGIRNINLPYDFGTLVVKPSTES